MVELPVPGALMLLGWRFTLAPEGAPETDKLTWLLKPPLTATVMMVPP